MATGTITKRSVDALQAEPQDAFLWDGELRGFGVKVTPAGAKTYVYSYRVGGREASKRRYTIGRHGSPWTPVSARQRAEQLALMVAQGVDPATADRERREEAVTLAFDAYAERFIRDYLTPEWPRMLTDAEQRFADSPEGLNIVARARMTAYDDLTPSENLEIDALETSLQLRAFVEALEAAGVDPEAITAALLAAAVMSRRKHHGSDQVVPWLMRVAQREGANQPSTQCKGALRSKH